MKKDFEMGGRSGMTVDLCRRINRPAAIHYAARGIEAADVVIAAICSAHNLATDLHAGDGHAAIEHMRTALNLMERQLPERASAAN